MENTVAVPAPPASPEARQQDGAAAPGPRPRDASLDNARFLLLVLVVAGHTWSASRTVQDSTAVRAAYAWVYLFHMPAFVLVSGYLSRGFAARRDQTARLVGGVLVPYVVFTCLYCLFRSEVLGQRHISLDLLRPWYASWFLVALFLWRLGTPLWRSVRHPFAVAVLVALLSGTTDNGDILSFGRVLQFLPFFVLGLQLRPEHLARLRTRRVRAASAAVLAALAAGAYVLVPHVRTLDWLNRDRGYGQLHTTLPHYLAVSAALLACTLAACAAFLSLVPARTAWFTALGTRTMYAYLLHPMLVKLAQYRGWYDGLHGPLGELALTAAAVLTATVLMTAPVRRVLRPLVEPRLRWLLRP
ncbi:acyltransferase family protein [Streptomyces sp. NPDC001380]|uniref:acyltransferase family protein n=1 Tax=Streptomyces sp. NPDC001380 TaxID=3364566 RepID=UPI0036B38B04